MSEIKNVGYMWMAKCNQLTPLPFKGLIRYRLSQQLMLSILRKGLFQVCSWTLILLILLILY